ncbi:hypothetical protein ACFSC4_10095 [Deinococcus malanensis]
MQIRFLGQSAFLLQAGNHRVLIDPFLQGNPCARSRWTRRCRGKWTPC